MADDAARARREARKDWTIQRFGPGEEEAMADADELVSGLVLLEDEQAQLH